MRPLTTRKTKNWTTRKEMEMNARGCSKHLTKRHVRKLNLIKLLRLTHPMDRVDFARKLKDAGKISEAQLQKFIEAKKQWDKKISYN